MEIMWHQRSLRRSRSDRLERDDALRAHTERWSRCDERQRGSLETTTGRHCPTCGSTTHGRPWVRLPDGGSPHVSLSRCGEHVVTVIADHPVGIDVESIEAVDARWDPALVLHPTEPNPHDPGEMRTFAHDPGEMRGPGSLAEERAAIWCRKEAILKALGTGLSTPMSEIRVADWQVEDIPAPEGFAAAVALIPQAGRGGSSTS